MLNIAWAPRIKRDERSAHEQLGAREGLSDYHVRFHGLKVVCPFLPNGMNTFQNSIRPNRATVYGIDISDGVNQTRTLAHIRDEDALSITSPLLLHTGQGNRLGFWAGLPVYAHGLPHETVEARRKSAWHRSRRIPDRSHDELDPCKDKNTDSSLCVFRQHRPMILRFISHLRSRRGN